MHGVLKVKTTAEQEAERKKQKDEKAAKILELSKQIYKKRKENELDDELLSLTEQLLDLIPDSNTMWNIRKETLLQFNKEKSEEEMTSLYQNELKFIQRCLLASPKSYAVWEHRRFSLTNMPKPDWQHDLKLCSQFLSYDPRNFHCWDYRRFVVKKANISNEDEFKFTFQKISENFSNYSAWHYRSKLLPLICPDSKKCNKVDEKALLKEFEFVQNAFFTDPNDQSAWFYQRWLLGREEREADILHFHIKVLPNGLRLMLSLSKQLNLQKEKKLEIKINDEMVENLVWKSSDGSNLPTYVWTTTFDRTLKEGEYTMSARLGNGNERHCLLQQGSNECSWHWSQAESDLIFRDDHTEAKINVLQNELESCQMLLEEEVENKWVMLTMVFLMRAIDPEKFREETCNLLTKLVKCDYMRKEYYRDLRSKYKIEDELRRKKREQESFDKIDLHNEELSAIFHWQYLTAFKNINLSGNQITTLGLLHSLQNVNVLNLDENKICSLDGFSELPFLEDLSLKENCIKTVDEVKKLRSSTIKKLCLAKNPVCASNENFGEIAKELLSADLIL